MSLTWVNVSLNQSNFNTPEGEYSISTQDTFSYALLGNTMFLTVKIDTSTLSSDGASEIRITIPNNRRVVGRNVEFLYYNTNDGERYIGLINTTVGNSFISLFQTTSKFIYWRMGSISFSLSIMFETEIIP